MKRQPQTVAFPLPLTMIRRSVSILILASVMVLQAAFSFSMPRLSR